MWVGVCVLSSVWSNVWGGGWDASSSATLSGVRVGDWRLPLLLLLLFLLPGWRVTVIMRVG